MCGWKLWFWGVQGSRLGSVLKRGWEMGFGTEQWELELGVCFSFIFIIVIVIMIIIVWCFLFSVFWKKKRGGVVWIVEILLRD